MLSTSRLNIEESLKLTREQAILLQKTLSEAKAENIKLYDLAAYEKNSYSDIILIAGAASPLHLKSLATHAHRQLKDLELRPYGGYKRQPHEDRWIVVDCGAIVLHLFMKEDRDYYDLDRKIEREIAGEDPEEMEEEVRIELQENAERLKAPTSPSEA